MNKALKVKKGPASSTTKFSIGTKKSKRLFKLEKDPESVWGKNKKLEAFWRKLASGKEVILVYTNNKVVKFTMPKTYPAKSNKYKDLENDNNIKAIITSAESIDSYESLYKKVKNKTPQEIIKNYKKYLINYGNDKNWYL